LFIKVVTVILLFVALHTEAKPHTSTVYSKSLDGHVRVKILNEMTRTLACYVAIDGYKIKFRLTPMHVSKWHSATNKAHKYSDFSTWCGYIEQYPAYLEYKMY
jgi:hypothetical protein